MKNLRKFHPLPQLVLALGLVLGLLGPAPAARVAGAANLQPLVAQLAAAAPEQLVAVIVQKADTSTAAEAAVARLGGTVTQDLHIINAFVAEMTAGAARDLAANPSVRWVSLDAPTRSSTISSIDVRVAASSDDAEEEGPTGVYLGSGGMYLVSTDLELMRDLEAPSSGTQVTGLRFAGIGVPPGATITAAYLRFKAIAPDSGNSNSDTANFTLQAQAADNPGTFLAANSNLSSRPRTTAAVQWTPAAWTTGTTYDSPNLASIVQELVNRPGWVSGNSQVFILRCTDGQPGASCGSRSAESWDGNPATAPLLHIEWDNGAAPPPPAANPVFVTWAAALGPEEPMGLSNGLNLSDSYLGPNGTYAIGLDNNKGAVTLFQPEATLGNSVTRVEVLLSGYVPSVMAHDFKIKIWLGGTKIKDYTVAKELWTAYVGASQPGLVAIDITGARAWSWVDLDNRLAVSFDFGPFGGSDSLALDAIGLRITSAPGAGAPSDSGGDPSALVTIDAGQQVNVYNQVIRATDLWNVGSKLQGKGVTVAVVDSGVFRTKDISKRVRTNVNLNAAYHDGSDRFGHGTFVAGIIAGDGSSSGRKYVGVAPRADVLNVRVSDDTGMSTEAAVVGALQWVLDNKAKYNIRVVNLSLNSSVAQSYHTSPLDAAVEVLWFNGIVVVVSAGNNGTATLYPPANDPFVITVGATNDAGTVNITDDTVAAFSAYGLTESGYAKPDLVAPGTSIIGLLPENDLLNIGQAHPGNRIDKTYFRMSGTSVSAPIVAGAIALLLQDEPNLTPDQVKFRLMATANKAWAGYNAVTAGAGYLDIYAAVYGTTTQSANTGIAASQLLWTGATPVTWGSVNWNSVNWNSVNWNSVNWNSVNWNSVNWNSDYWGQ